MNMKGTVESNGVWMGIHPRLPLCGLAMSRLHCSGLMQSDDLSQTTLPIDCAAVFSTSDKG